MNNIWHFTEIKDDSSKPAQGEEVLLLMKDDTITAGYWIRNANKYHMNVRKWRLTRNRKTVSEGKVKAWLGYDELGLLISIYEFSPGIKQEDIDKWLRHVYLQK